MGLSFQIHPFESRTNHARAVFQQRQRCVYRTGSARSSRRVQFALTREQAVAATLPFFSFTVFFQSSGNERCFCPQGQSWYHLQKTSLVLSQAFQRVAILSPLWPETFQWPSLTSFMIIPAVDSLAEYEPWWSCKVAFSGLCHPQSDISAIITTACNKFSNINCTVPALEPRIINAVLPPPWLRLCVFNSITCTDGISMTLIRQGAAEQVGNTQPYMSLALNKSAHF